MQTPPTVNSGTTSKAEAEEEAEAAEAPANQELVNRGRPWWPLMAGSSVSTKTNTRAARTCPSHTSEDVRTSSLKLNMHMRALGITAPRAHCTCKTTQRASTRDKPASAHQEPKAWLLPPPGIRNFSKLEL